MPQFRLSCVALLVVVASACGANPTAPATSSVAVTGTVPDVGQTSQLAAKAILSNGASQDVTGQARWSSSNAEVATVTAGGLLKVLQLGVAQITATYQNVSGQFSVSLTASGTWSGTNTDSAASCGPGTMILTLSQTGTSVSGMMSVRCAPSSNSSTSGINSTLSGRIAGATITMTTTPQSVLTVNLTATANGNQMSGTYAYTACAFQPCVQVSTGTFNLTKLLPF
jgi:Big-like domain-containing protein